MVNLFASNRWHNAFGPELLKFNYEMYQINFIMGGIL